jgi:ABC-2 type transport system ATP-binding protein
MSATVQREQGRERDARSPAQLAPALLELRGIAKRWPRAAAPLLAGVELSVRAGETVAVTGRNGAGKTTLLRIAAGLLAPDAGSVRVQGLDPERERTAFQSRVGLLSAGNSGLYGRLSVERHLEFWARLALLPRRRRSAAIERARARFALDELCGQRVDRLSMGQRQRVRLALAFLHEPDVVLLDEPRTSLDEEGAELLTAAIAGLTALGGAAVVCAPRSEDAGIPFDRRHLVQDGALVPA